MAAPVRVGIVGTGWGLKVQAPKFRAAGLKIAALYSRDSARAATLAETHGIPNAFSSVEALSACPDVDLVSVVSPAHERRRHVLAALAAGKSVLASKPLGVHSDDAVEMWVAARSLSVGKLALVEFELRCVPAVRRARELVASGELGPVQFVSFSTYANFPFFADGAGHSHWSDRRTGGGVFSAVGVHFVDLVRFVLQDEVARVSAVEAALGSHVVSDDVLSSECLVSANMITNGGVAIHVLISGRSPGLPHENRATIVCAAGVIQIDFATSGMSVWNTNQGDGPMERIEGGGNAWSEVGTFELGKRIKAALEDGASIADLASFRDGIASQRVADAVHASADQQSAWVDVDVSLDS